MAGIYIHIPFCKQLCHYCDFYKSLEDNHRSELLDSLGQEMELQRDYFEGEEVETIYIGGGTPTILSVEEINSLIGKISTNFQLTKENEITIEANPDDLTREYLEKLAKTKVNRISIGIQSLSAKELVLLNRRHTVKQAIDSVTNSKKAGFTNISLDLMYGIPGSLIEQWERNIDQVLAMDVQHLSCYHLSIEPGTKLALFVKNGKIKPPEEEESIDQFRILAEKLDQAGFLHYEISNFCKNSYFSKHNTNYWKQIKYLGIGPSAHSFNGRSRQWNIADNKKYIETIKKNKVPFKKEIIDQRKKYNEYILTALRTMWGIDLKYIEETFSKEAHDYCINLSERLLEYGMLKKKGENLVLTKQGIFISDNIITELMMND